MIGERLADVRKDNKDKQADLAEKLNVSLSTIRSWEQGKSSPPHEALVNICKIYSVSSDFLLGLSDDDPFYAKLRQTTHLSNENQIKLREFEDFLIWKQQKG
ncbi:MAG: helix-turn-helix transcriptional regulator [Faecalibacterium sp.]